MILPDFRVTLTNRYTYDFYIILGQTSEQPLKTFKSNIIRQRPFDYDNNYNRLGFYYKRLRFKIHRGHELHLHLQLTRFISMKNMLMIAANSCARSQPIRTTGEQSASDIRARGTTSVQRSERQLPASRAPTTFIY